MKYKYENCHKVTKIPSLYLVSVLIYDYRIQEFPFISLINQTKTLKLGQWK